MRHPIYVFNTLRIDMSYFKNRTLTTDVYGTPTLCGSDLAAHKTDMFLLL